MGQAGQDLRVAARLYAAVEFQTPRIRGKGKKEKKQAIGDASPGIPGVILEEKEGKTRLSAERGGGTRG